MNKETLFSFFPFSFHVNTTSVSIYMVIEMIYFADGIFWHMVILGPTSFLFILRLNIRHFIWSDFFLTSIKRYVVEASD